jgi:hypothetical protein
MKKVLLPIMTIVMGLSIAVCADDKEHADRRNEAFRAVNKQLIQDMNVKVLHANLFSRRMPTRYYSAEIAQLDASSMQVPFTVQLHDRNILPKIDSKQQTAKIVGPAAVEVAKGFYDRKTKTVMVQLDGKPVPPAVFIQSLLGKTI